MTQAVPEMAVRQRKCTSQGCWSLYMSRQRSPRLVNMAGIMEKLVVKKAISKTDRAGPVALISASATEKLA